MSALLHRGPVPEVAVLAAGLVEELHPLLRELAGRDPRPRWQRAAAAAALLRAAVEDPCRAMVLAARERAVDGDVHVRAEGADPDTAALRHALRVWAVLRTAGAAGRAPEPGDAERYVSGQRSSAVLLGAEPDDLPGTLEEVEADVERVRGDVLAGRPAAALSAVGPPPAAPPRPRSPFPDAGGAPAPWARATLLAGAVLPGWARALFTGAPDDLGGPGDPRLREALARLPDLGAAPARPR
ncbi:oxygenase MpaB family protein [Kineococcus gypseus]|uniref:oxygenase MpaB family protein n=1 Tax=Kineococcus gypseus TaxID=1637102 RepID=UPI003D7D8672